RFSSAHYRMVQSFVFIIEEINKNTQLLPNFTLGFTIWDSESSELGALWGTMALLTGQGYPVPNYDCTLPETPLAAILGEDRSALSIPMATWLGLYRIPQFSYLLKSVKQQQMTRKNPLNSFQEPFTITWIITLSFISHFQVTLNFAWHGGYGSTVSLLSDKLRFPSFLRTLPPDEARLRRAACTLAAAQPRVLLVFAAARELLLLAVELWRQGTGQGRLWISSEVWEPALPAALALSGILSGALSFSGHRGRLPGFLEFLGRLHPAHSPEDKFLPPFWEETFHCQWSLNSSAGGVAVPGGWLGGEEGGGGKVGKGAEAVRGARRCTGEETLQGQVLPFLDMSDLSVTYAVANAVASVAQALHDMATCEVGTGPFEGRCADVPHFRPWQLLHYLRRVRFRNSYGEEVLFDAHGDPPALYDVMRWQPGPEGYPSFQEVARFNDMAARESQLQMNASGLTLEGMEKQVEKQGSSLCQKTCPPGTWRTSQIGQASCCFACLQCPVGQVSEHKADAPACKECPDDTTWPSPSRDRCELQPDVFLKFGDPLGAVLASLGVCVSLATGLVLGVFIYHRHTPLVRASSPGLSALLLSSLLLCSLSSLLFLGPRGPFDCRLCQVVLSLTFTTAVSCVLARTAAVLVAFRAVQPGGPLQVCLGPGLPRAMVAGPLVAQVCICIACLGVAPQSQSRSPSLAPNTVPPECREALPPGFWVLLGLLALAGFVLALWTRQLPGGFCEAHLLSLSMAMCVSVWLASLPAQLHSQGRAVAAAVQTFSILASNAALLGFIFLPRCFVILLRPHRNNRAWLMGRLPASGPPPNSR
uniref:G-protein coupled receptors family 3 profile domain-containing protein n=1 Tax=Sarcophilus harrisii TaxID=9305 RepID=G3VM02_SARHA